MYNSETQNNYSCFTAPFITAVISSHIHIRIIRMFLQALGLLTISQTRIYIENFI